MNLLRKIFGEKDRTKEPNVKLPLNVTLLPNKLTADIFSHKIITDKGESEGLAYLTNGLKSLGQRELFLVLKDKNQQYENWEEPLHFFAQVYSFAENGKLVDTGDFTQFGKTDFLGWFGIVYTDFPNIENDPRLKDCLAMTLLSTDEVIAVQKFGYLRVVSLLGKEDCYYPHPYWADLERKPLPIKEIESSSIVSSVGATLKLSQASTILENNEISLVLPNEILINEIIQKVPSNAMTFAIFPGLNKTANGCLVFTMDNGGHAAITPEGSDGSKLCGCVLIVGAEQQSNFTRIYEDGFGLIMTNETWIKFWESFIHKKNMFLEIKGNEMNFRMVWE